MRCKGSSVRCKEVVVEKSVVWCSLCVSLPVCCVVAVRCAVAVCCCCGSGVVVGAEGRAGVVCCSSLLPREVVGVVATVTAAAQSVADLDEDDHVVSTNPVVALVAETCLDEVGAVAKAQAC